ncbi:MAG: non-homologous end-joining DNA ligase, partial [Bryobacteraceae bacterium]
MKNELRFGRYRVEITHADKVLFPDGHLTKSDLLDYYLEIAPVMLPHLKDRPVVMERFPDGIDGAGFYHKDVPDYFPDWIERLKVRKEGGSVTHLICRNAATLAYLVNQNCITPHSWLSRSDEIRNPDQLVFDLDPPGDFSAARHTAFALKDLLEEIGLRPYVKTTGSRGLHVVVVLDRSANFDTVRAFAQDVAAVLAEREPKRVTIEHRKAKRGQRVFVDTGRNAYAQTMAPAYAVRPKPSAPVSTPITWDELEPGLDAQSFHMKEVRRRLAQRRDPL